MLGISRSTDNWNTPNAKIDATPRRSGAAPFHKMKRSENDMNIAHTIATSLSDMTAPVDKHVEHQLAGVATSLAPSKHPAQGVGNCQHGGKRDRHTHCKNNHDPEATKLPKLHVQRL